MIRALQGIRVVEVAQFAAVPAGSAILADFGADVIKVERPAGGDAMRGMGTGGALGLGAEGDGFSIKYEVCNRNKRSVTVDISKPAGREIVCGLARNADVFLSNLRPRELSRYDLEYATLSRLNPRLIYGNLTGYGRKGPECEAPGFDSVSFWTRTGIAHLLRGSDDVPPFNMYGIGDLSAALALALGVAIAIIAREQTGVGQELDVSLLAVGLWAHAMAIQDVLGAGSDIDRRPREDAVNPLTNMYRSKDGRWLALAHVQPDLHWPRLCRAIERPHLERDARFSSMQARTENNRALVAILDAAFAERPHAEWLERLAEHGLVYSLVSTAAEAIADPQVKAMACIQDVPHPTRGRVSLVTPPLQLSRTPFALRTPAPRLGEHNEEVLLDLGYSSERIAELREAGVIA